MAKLEKKVSAIYITFKIFLMILTLKFFYTVANYKQAY